MKNKFFKKGFSLIETLVVLSVFGLLVGFVLTTINGSRNEISLKDAQTALIFSLEQARNRAAAGVGNGAHGIYINNDDQKVFAFQGDSYQNKISEEEIYFPFFSFLDENAEIIFGRLTGNATGTKEIEFNYNGTKKTIFIEETGRIISQ
jgi:prepilin-type N-terminal cleavage/methylation domain-containing protein